MQVRQFHVKNQFLITGVSAGQFYCGTNHKSGDAFQSYDSMIAFKDFEGRVYLDEKYWNYSRTTSKYRNMFLNETTKETEKFIDSGLYKLVKMN